MYVEHVLVEHSDRYVKASFLERQFGDLVGDGLLVSEGDLWRQQRRRIQPAFQPPLSAPTPRR
ncbi:cytochrome P450 [Haloprofundus halobius]|uniref:cytochrome P450 n=1 Tax=Haloprofundus halobius TaxID=2876194 RepID=UPI001CCD6029|nr:cytochrome P450 [Haloprofundus halobius]